MLAILWGCVVDDIVAVNVVVADIVIFGIVNVVDVVDF